MKKVDDYIELQFTGNEDYAQCVDKALNSLAVVCDDSEEGCLFRLNGSRIIDQPINSSDGTEMPWTLMGYLETFFQKRSQFKLGVGVIEVRVTIS